MISGSTDNTIRRWDLRKGKEIEEAREVSEYVRAAGVSRDGRWVVTAGSGGLKVSEVETRVVKTFDEGDWFNCIDISANSTLLAGGSYNHEARIWNLDTGELVAGPFKSGGEHVAALRFSEDSRKLAMMSYWEKHWHLQVWDVKTQKLDVQRSTYSVADISIFWTTKDRSVVAAFGFMDAIPTMIYECDASTLKTIGAPFEHTTSISSLALSADCVLLASSSSHIKLWAFQSRQLLASFSKYPVTLILSPDSRQLAYTTFHENKIYICNIPAGIFASIESVCIHCIDLSSIC
jgi:WD40 repeat protein